MKSKSPTTLLVILILLLSLCLVCLCVMILGGTAILTMINTDQVLQTEVAPTPTARPFPTSVPFNPDSAPDKDLLQMAADTLLTVTDEIVPINNPVDLAERLGGKQSVPSTLIDTVAPYKVGEEKSFWVTNTDNNENFQVDAVLRYLGENIYFWIEDGVRYDPSDLEELAATFDQQIIPTNRDFFGMEWNPGVDGDPRFYVLYAGGLGSSIAGYYSSADQVHPDAHPFSNAHEMFLMNSDTVGLDEDYIYGTMAHEFQHMIHWYQDKNEETWLNEGASMLAEHVNEYDAGGFDYEYMLNPDLQLTDWGGDTGQNGPHYGASYLFMVYFLDRFGEEATKALVAHEENGFASIDEVMQELNLVNPNTGTIYTANELFADWSVANYLQDPDFENGRYGYQSYSPYIMSTTQSIWSCPDQIVRDVYQYGVNYIELGCGGNYSVSFEGTQAVNILPFESPSSGDYFFWSNMGDESNPTLSQTFDLRDLTGPINLTFKTWYDLEEDYDYVFLSASTDKNKWEILNTKHCTTDNPSGNSYGCGWNGQSEGWISESVDLSKFAGETVTIQFDYVTDAAVNGMGMALDDFALTAIDYQSDLELDEGGWEGNGFVRVQNTLPQTYALTMIRMGSTPSVTTIPLDAKNVATFDISIDGDDENVILVISGTTPVTREKALYKIDIK